MTANPVLIELIHGSGIGSQYRGVAVVADRDGGIVHTVGDIKATTCIRSSLKPLQARALVETGAADAFGLTDEHLALAAGSHAGEPMHVVRIEEWLNRLGLDENHLACGAAWPFHGPSHERLIRQGGKPRRVYHNCAGKHAGFLTIARHLGVGVDGYCTPDHPVQQAVLGGIRDLMGLDPMAGINVDGCNAPNFHAPLTAYAQAFVRLQDDPAGARVLAAMAAYPELVSGTGRFVARLAGATGGAVIAKDGAEGAVMAMAPAQGLVLVLKMDDGAMAPAHAAACHILKGLGVLSADAVSSLDTLLSGPMLSSTGQYIGGYQATDTLLAR